MTLSGSTLAANIEHWSAAQSLPTALQALVVLFTSYVCSALAMRFDRHASFVMSMPVASPERQPLNALAAEHVHRGCLLYSWGLRLFLTVAAVVAGIVPSRAMLPVMLLLVALHRFDRPADLGVDWAHAGSGGAQPAPRGGQENPGRPGVFLRGRPAAEPLRCPPR